MKFTMSKDGVERCTVILRDRLTREEWQMLTKRAKQIGCSPISMLESEASLAVEDYLCRLKMKDRCTLAGTVS